MQNSRKTLIFFVIILSLFTAGMVELFALRFEAGDIYPPYSSLRSDPIGSRGMHDSLENLGTVEVARNYLPIRKIRNGADTTLFFLGIEPRFGDALPEPVFGALDRFVLSGGRFVATFLPISEKIRKGSGACDKDKTARESADEKKKEGESEENADEKEMKRVSMSEQWEFTYDSENTDSEKNPMALQNPENRSLERFTSVSWHSAMRFNELSSGWNVIYSIDGKPVLIERQYGRGSLVFSSDSYFVSNEALRNEKHPELLAWLTGKNGHVVFDESHLGIRKNPGIVTLVRKYNLHGLIVSLILFSVLFVWKNSSCFVPPVEIEESGRSGNSVSARDHSSGLVSLLRKNIGKKKLLDVCVNEWRKSFVADNEASKEYADIYEKIKITLNTADGASRGDEDPVKGYARVCRILSEKERL